MLPCGASLCPPSPSPTIISAAAGVKVPSHTDLIVPTMASVLQSFSKACKTTQPRSLRATASRAPSASRGQELPPVFWRPQVLMEWRPHCLVKMHITSSIGFPSSCPHFPCSFPTPPEIIPQMNQLQPCLGLRLGDLEEPRQMNGTGGGCKEQPKQSLF